MNFYIPVEIKKRDYLSRLLVAYYAAKRGYNVLIGSKNQIDKFVKYSKPGIYLGLVTTKTYSKFYIYLKKKNFKIFVIDEEGLITFDDKMYLDLKVSGETLNKIEKLFTWGEEHKNIISKKYPEFKKKISSTGTPRFDLFLPRYRNIFEQKVRKIQNDFGNFTLICGSFSFVNHYTKDLNYLEVLKLQNVIKNLEDEKRFLKYCKYNRESFENFIYLTINLSKKFQNHKFIYRPHPAENIDIYKEHFKNYENIIVDNQYTLIEWIIASKCIIHSYCTSSIEALLVDKARFGLKENFDQEVHKTIPYEFTEASSDLEDLMNKLSIFYKNNYDYSNFKNFNIENLSKYISNNSNKISSEKIVDEISKFFPPNKKIINNYLDHLNFKFLNVIRYFKSLLYYLNKDYIKHIKYLNHKFGNITLNEIQKDLKFFEDQNYLTVVTKIDRNLFSINKKHEKNQ